MTYSIRPMVTEDLTQVNLIDREAFPTQWPPANYQQELQNKMARYIVATDDTRTYEETREKPRKGHESLTSWLKPWAKHEPVVNDTLPPIIREYIVGFSGIWVIVDEAHITNIAVRQEYQGQGMGELLLIATVDLARQLKANIMTLEVRESNLVAQNLYSKYGFTQTGTRHGYYLDNREDAVIMSTEGLSSDTFQTNFQQLRETLAKKLGQAANHPENSQNSLNNIKETETTPE